MAKEYLQDQECILSPHYNTKVALRIIIIFEIICLKHNKNENIPLSSQKYSNLKICPSKVLKNRIAAIAIISTHS